MFERFRLAVLGLAVLGVSALTLAGCGQKGPLYIHSEFDQELEDAATQAQLEEALEREESEAIGPGVGAHEDAGSLIPPP